MISFTTEEIETNRQEDIERLREEDDFVAENHVPGTFSYHEALHTASLVLGQVDEPLLGHSAVILDQEAYRLAHEAHTAIFNLYQYLGSKHLVEDEPKLNKDD